MKERLPAVKPLAATLEQTALPEQSRMRVKDSARYLASQQPILARFETPEDLGDAAYEHPNSVADALSFHLFQIRIVLSRALQAEGIFVSAIVLDELLLQEFSTAGSTRPVLAVLERIRDARMTRPGLILFPLHSFGILGAGFVHTFTTTRISVLEPRWGISLTPQTNSFDETLRFLEATLRAFKIRERLPTDLLEHWRRSRPADWLELNPLMAVRAIQVPGYYYDNEPLLLARLRAATGLLAMLAALQPENADRARGLMSSSSVNNRQTLNIHHYMVLYAKPGRRTQLSGDCIPIHTTRSGVVEASDLNIDLDSKYWTRQRQARADRAENAASTLYRGFLAHRHLPDARGRTYRKIFESLNYFKRSFSVSDWQATVSLATAFEMLLTDRYEPGVAARLQRRTQLLLRGTPGTRGYQEAVTNVYDARSEIVHTGFKSTAPPMHQARQAYVHLLIELCARLPRLRTNMAQPLGQLIGDSR